MQDAPTTDHADAEADVADGGIGMASVVVMLALLTVLVVGIFWVMPAWFGSSVIEVTIRN